MMTYSMLLMMVRRYRRMFASMVVVSALAVMMLVGLTSSVANTNAAYEQFKADYGYADCIITTDIIPNEYTDGLSDVDGVEDYDRRVSINASLRTRDDDLSTIMLCTYLPDDAYKRYVVDELENPDGSYIQITAEKRYAENNGMEVGDIVTLSMYGTSIEAQIASIAYTPETVYVNPNPYLLSDNAHYGYVFISDEQMAAAIDRTQGEGYNPYALYGRGSLVADGQLQYCNQLLITCAEGCDCDAVLENCKAKMSENASVLSAAVREDTASEGYMKMFDESLGNVSYIFPAFFYIVMLLVISLFFGQIVMNMKTDIGVLMALGTRHKQILKIMSAFALCITVCAFVIGLIGGKLLSITATNIFSDIYQVPVVSYALNYKVGLVGAVATIVVGQAAVLMSSVRVLKITPKDAMSNNSSAGLSLPVKLENKLDRLSPRSKMNFCITVQNPRRVIMSVFAIATATVLILAAFFFYVSNKATLTQTLDGRYAFDMHLLIDGADDGDREDILRSTEGIDRVEKIKYAYLTVRNDAEDVEKNIKICGMAADTELLNIPDENGDIGNVKVEGDGIWLNIDEAKELGVTTGDTVSVNGVDFEVKGLTYEFMHKVSAMSMDGLQSATGNGSTADISTGYLMRINDKKALNDYLMSLDETFLISDKDDISEDLHSRLNPLMLIVYVLVAFALLMAVIIILLMSQASLTEQQRLVCILELLGFSVKDISVMWLKQEIAYFTAGTVIGIPLGIIAEKVLLDMIRNSSWSFPFLLRSGTIILGVIIVLAAIVASHFVSMRSIESWNLADKTRDRE